MKVFKKIIEELSPSAIRDMFNDEGARHMLVYQHKKWTIYSETSHGIKSTTHLNRISAHKEWKQLKQFRSL